MTLADAWRAWVVDNLLAGAEPARVIDGLIQSGVPAALARREVSAIAESPALAGCVALAARVARRDLLARLARELARTSPEAGAVPRRSGVSAEEFFDRYFAGNRPVVLTDVTAGWRALDRWTPAYFKARFGACEVEASTGREGDSAPDRNFAAHRETMTMAELVDRVLAAGVSNDVYLIANNRATERPELAPLLDDIAPDTALFDPRRLRGATSLWLGPAGTVTPLHHDTTNIAFCQIYGRKRFALASPAETALLDCADGFYSGLDVAEAAAAGVQFLEVTLSPGEAMFIPAGWWHEVTALDVSISFSLLNFRRPNDYDWYRPGGAPR